MSLPLPNWNLHVQIHSCPRLQAVSVYCHSKNLTKERTLKKLRNNLPPLDWQSWVLRPEHKLMHHGNLYNLHGLLPISARKESKVSTPLARLTHSPCTDAFAPGKPHLQLPRLAGPAATNLLIQETKEEHGRTPNSKLQCVPAPVRLETTVGASTIAASMQRVHQGRTWSTFLRWNKNNVQKESKAFDLPQPATSPTPLHETGGPGITWANAEKYRKCFAGED